MARNILLILSIMLAVPSVAGCAVPEKTVEEIPPPLTEHKTFKASLSFTERKDIANLIKELEGTRTVLLRDPGDTLNFQSRTIDELVKYGRKAIPSLQKEYLRLKNLEREAAQKLAGQGTTGAKRDQLTKKRYALKTRRYAVMQPLLRINHKWNAHFFAVELCSHYDRSAHDFSSDELTRGDIAVRKRAADYLYKHGDEKYLLNLIWALLDEDRDIARTAVTALRRITGQDFGLIDARTEEAVAKSVNTWWDWYRGHLRRKRN